MKKIIIILLIFLFTGCSSYYDISYNGNIINEKISIEIPNKISNESIKKLEEYMNDGAIAVYNKIPNVPYYDIIKEPNKYIMKYSYKKGELENSTILNECFNTFKVEETNNYYMIILKGEFKCLYDNDEIIINVNSINGFGKNNSIEKIDNNNYRWVINEKNKNNVDIKYIVFKDKQNNEKFPILKNFIIISSIIFIIISSIFIFIKLKSLIDKDI